MVDGTTFEIESMLKRILMNVKIVSGRAERVKQILPNIKIGL